MTAIDYLIQILAITDSVWTPPRAGDTRQPAWGSIAEKQIEYPAGGVRLKIGGTTAERQTAGRRLAELADDGLLKIFNVAGQRTGVKLTDRGEAFGRAIVGLLQVDASWDLLRQVISLAVVTSGSTLNPLARETWLAGVAWYDAPGANEKIIGVEQKALPALARKWLIAASDSHGAVCYSPTDAGFSVAVGAKPDVPADLPDYDENAIFAYLDFWQASLNEIRTTPAKNRGLCGRPGLPVSLNLPLVLTSTRGKRRAKKADTGAHA
jgi:hypothetical protein